MENFRKKSNRNPGNKKSLTSNKKYSGKLLQKTRTSRRQNFMAQRQNRYQRKKPEEFLDKRLNSCERNIQEISNFTKRQNLETMGIEEGEMVQIKGIYNMFNKIITENFPNLKKEMPI
jgi:hypothetical protein